MDLIKEINDKYLALEAEVDKKLEKVKREEEKLDKLNEKFAEKTAAISVPKILSYEEAMARNANLLKSLEMAKARLRSRSTFSPIEQILEKAIVNYKRDLEVSMAPETRLQGVQAQENRQQTVENENIYEVLQNCSENQTRVGMLVPAQALHRIDGK